MTREIMQFTKSEIENELNTIKDWPDFDEKFKNIFINQLSGLGFTSPIKEDVFNAFKLFKPKETKVLIIGQDPYPETKKAYNKSDFKKWASDNKVLLLNTSLTYSGHPDKGKPYKSKEDEYKRKCETKMLKAAHQKLWRPFIKSIVSNLVKTTSSLVVFLWGEDAKDIFLDCVNERAIESKILILSTSHPLNTGNAKDIGFLEEALRHFELCNEFLKRNNKEEIYWKDLRKIYQG